MKKGCILCGGVGSGKSRTALAYYYICQGGELDTPDYVMMKNPKDLYIITTARKRDTLEWELEMAPFIFNAYEGLKVTVDSWNNIKKYTDVKDAFFIFDEQRVVGSGQWVKSFLKISRNGKTVQHHEDIWVEYDRQGYRDICRHRWNPWENEPIQNASGFCQCLRKLVNLDESRFTMLLEILEKHPKAIIFYNYDYELDLLRGINDYFYPSLEIAEWNGHKHQDIPDGDRWVYLVQYNAGAEGWNCIKTDTIIFYSQNYSYKVMVQASGRIDRMNTPYTDLYFYHLKSRSSIDLAISKALREKKKFNETRFYAK